VCSSDLIMFTYSFAATSAVLSLSSAA